jgi:thioesterase domain-containing protein
VVLYRPPLDRFWKVTGGNWVSAAREYVHPDNQWTPFAPDLEVVEVPGDHDSMVLEPNVRVLAARLRAAIANAEGPVEEALRKVAAE